MDSITERIWEGALQVCSLLTASETTDALVGGGAIDDVRQSLPAAATNLAGSPASLSGTISRLDDDRLRALLTDAARLRSEIDAVIAAGAGVIAKRSERDLGYKGLAQRTGHRTSVGLLQSLTGSSRTEAARQVRLGEAMSQADAAARQSATDGAGAGEELPPGTGVPGSDLPGTGESGTGQAGTGESGTGEADSAALHTMVPWFEPVTRAVAEHVLTSEAASAILRGLGQPSDHCPGDMLRDAAIEVIGAAAGINVDELTKRARWARDSRDPRGVEERFQTRYEERTWRFGRTPDGARTAWVRFDDENAAWVDAIVGSGMRPRRGGPRFVDEAEVERAQKLVDDPRTNDQLVFDLLMDVIRAGAQADPTIAFGSRQPGVRVVISKPELDKHDQDGHPSGVGYFEDTGEAIPAAVIERMICDAGIRPIYTDLNGNPLDVGREQRLFTEKQRVALAFRDGGCMDPNCDRPPSYTEAHHSEEWVADHGKTNLDLGILLCRYHHMLIHNNGWRILRENSAYWLVPPPDIDSEQRPIRLHSKAPNLAQAA